MDFKSISLKYNRFQASTLNGIEIYVETIIQSNFYWYLHRNSLDCSFPWNMQDFMQVIQMVDDSVQKLLNLLISLKYTRFHADPPNGGALFKSVVIQSREWLKMRKNQVGKEIYEITLIQSKNYRFSWHSVEKVTTLLISCKLLKRYKNQSKNYLISIDFLWINLFP